MSCLSLRRHFALGGAGYYSVFTRIAAPARVWFAAQCGSRGKDSQKGAFASGACREGREGPKGFLCLCPCPEAKYSGEDAVSRVLNAGPGAPEPFARKWVGWSEMFG